MDKAKAPALAKGLEIIDLIRLQGALSFIQLQEKMHENPASLNRYLHTLLTANYLYRNASMKYELGIKLLDLSDNKSIWPKLKYIFMPLLEEINQSFGVTTLLLAFANNYISAIEKVLAPDNLGMMAKNTVISESLTTIWSSRYFNQVEFAEYIEMFAEDTVPVNAIIKTKEEAKKLFEYIQFNGFMAHQEYEKQLNRFAFPITYYNQVIATIGIGTFRQAIDESHVNELSKMVKTRIEELSFNLPGGDLNGFKCF